MKRICILAIGVLLLGSSAFAQLKSQQQEQPSAASALFRPAPSLPGMLSWFNPDNFNMRHNLSFQYMSMGGRGMSMAMYTNSMMYRLANPLDVRFDVSLMGSPFGQYGPARQGDFSNLFLSRAELNYRPTDNMLLRLQYQQIPYGGFGMYSPYYYSRSPFSTFGD